MSLFGKLLGAEQRALTARDVEILSDGLGFERSLTGIRLTPRKALGASAVLQAVQVIACAVSSLPMILYRRTGEEGRERAIEHDLYPLLHDEPNRESSAGVFTRAQYLSKLLWGNRYAEIEFRGGGQVAAIWHLPPELVTPRRVWKRPGGGLTQSVGEATPEDRRRGGTLVYEVTDGMGGVEFLGAQKVFHIADHITYDGVTGVSRIRAALEPIALALAAQESAASVYGNDASPGGVLERPKEAPTITPNGERSLIAAFEATHGGVRRKGRLAVLQEGTVFKPISFSPTDAKLVEMMQLSILHVAHIFHVPPYFLGHPGSSETYSNIEAEWSKLVNQTLLPHLVDDRQEIHRKLLLPREQRELFAEYETKALLRGDTKTRADFYKQMIELGVMTPATVAQAENLPPVPEEQGGKTYRAPLNFGPAAALMGLGLLGFSDLLEDPAEDRGRRRALPAPELRAARVAESRTRIRRSYERLIAQALERHARRREARLKAARKRAAGDELAAELEKINRDLEPGLRGELHPIFLSLAEALQEDVVREIGGEVRPPSEQLQAFIHELAVAAARRQLDSPSQEAVRAVGAISVALYREASMLVRWHAPAGEPEACRALDGVIRSPGEDFAPGRPNPPLTDDCSCLLTAG